MTPSELLGLLDDLGITYKSYEHAPVFTCEQAYAALPNEPAVQTKNLFLRDKRGRRHLLLVTSCEKAVDVKAFADQASRSCPTVLCPCYLERPAHGCVAGIQARL